ncbi:MAG: bacterial type II secretion system protein F domain protein, partial [Bacillota bacterium]|nr:bacterial type II secretion system protein F domain protein [Bacillota bacterium]
EDNINKGSSLAEKLEAEGTLLWMDRKKRAEERARLAETKLSFPLMLLLLSLMIITTAPILLSL